LLTVAHALRSASSSGTPRDAFGDVIGFTYLLVGVFRLIATRHRILPEEFSQPAILIVAPH
jgi:hypothetical protein